MMFRRAVFCSFWLVGVVLTAQAQTLTAPGLVNSYAGTDIRNDERPHIVSDGNGTWVAAWDSQWWQADQYGADVDLFFARSTNNGQTWSTAAILNTNAASDGNVDDLRPILATDGAGNWVCVWQAAPNGGEQDVLVSRSSNNGQTWTAPALLNTNGASDNGTDELPKVATDGLGNWVAVWDTNTNIGGSGTDFDVRVATSTNNGATWTAPALLNSNGTTDSGTDTRVELTTDSFGTWVAMWQANNFAGSDNDILVSRSTNNGATWTAPALVNTAGDTADDQRPGLATNGAGAWVAVWTSTLSTGGSGTDFDVFASRSTNGGATWTAPALLNSNAVGDAGADETVRVVTDGVGNWVATWAANANFNSSDSDYDVWFSRSTDNGATWTVLSLLNTNGQNDSLFDLVPQLAADGAGNWVGVWESNDLLTGNKGSDWDILHTRFTLAPLTLSVSSNTPATTGPTNATSVNFAVSFSQAVTGFDAAADLVINHTGTANSGVSFTGGPQNFTVSVTGISGNGSFTMAPSTTSNILSTGGQPLVTTTTSAAVSIDNTAPTIALSSLAGDPVGGGISVTATLSESSSNFVAADITTANANVVNFGGSGASYTFTLVPVTNGLFSASVALNQFTDAAGNQNTASNTVERTADITAPSITLSSAAGDPVSGGISVTATLSASSSNFAAEDISTTNGAASNFQGSGSSYTFTLTPTTGGLFSASVAAGRFTDGNSNANTASNTLSRTADLVAPTATLTSAAAATVNGAISVTVTLSESSSNFEQVDISTTNGAVSNFQGSGTSYSFTLTPSVSGSFSASVPLNMFTDAAGNQNPASNTLSRTADLIAPTATLSSAAGDPVTGPIAVTVTLSESSSNFVANDITAVNGAVSNFNGSGASYSFTLTPVVSGLFSASVPLNMFTDAAGNNNPASNTLSRTANLPNGVGITPSAVARLNTDFNGDSRVDERPQIETDGLGNWVSVWDVFGGPSGNDYDIYFSRSTDNGVTWSAPAPLYANPNLDAGDDLRPAIATDRAGNWITIWYSNDSFGGTKGTDYDVMYVRSTNAGQTWSAPAVLNTNATTDTGDDEIPRIAVNNTGNWVVVWDSSQDLASSGTDFDVFVSTSSNGTTWSPPALLNSNATVDAANDNRTEILTDRAGVWVVLWASNAALGDPTPSDDNDIFVSRSTNNGATWSTAVRIDPSETDDAGDDQRPALGTDGQGNWVAAWHGDDVGDFDIWTSRSSDGGVTWTPGVLLNNNGANDSGLDEFVRLMTDGAGNWFAIWDSSESLGGLNGSDYDVFIARSVNNGLTWTSPVTFNSNANTDDGFDLVAQLATNRAGNWVAVWESNNQPNNQPAGNEWDIFVSRFSLTAGVAATSIVPATTGPTTADSVSFTVSFNQNVVNFNNSTDLVITHTGTANSGATITGGPQNYSVNVTGITGNGSFTLAVSTTSDVQNTSGTALTSSVTSAAVSIDNISPTITLASAAPAAVSGPIAVTATLSESSTTFGSDDITTLVNATVSNFTGSGTSYSFTLTPQTSGTFSATVGANGFMDAAGNNNTASNTLSRTANLTSPSITLTSAAAATVIGPITVTATLSASSTNFAAEDVTPFNATVSNFQGSGTAYTFTLTPSTDGTFNASVAADMFTDGVGNLNTASNTLSRIADLTRPTIVLASAAPDPVNGAIAVTATLSEASTNFVSGDVTRVNCAISNFQGSGTSYSFTLTPSASGVFSGTVNANAFTDAIGNGNLVSNTLSRTADITRPTATLSTSSGSTVGASGFNVTVTLSEAATDFVSTDVTTVNGTLSNFQGSGTSYSFTLTPIANGTVSASVPANRFTDAIGNQNTASNTLSRTADIVGPSLTLSSGAAATVRTGITVSVRLSQGGITDFAAEDITPVNATVSNFSGSGRNWSFTLTPQNSGTFSAQVLAGAFTDAVGNPNTASAVLSRTADLMPPTATLSSTAGDPVTGFITVTVVLSETSSNFTSGDVTPTNATVSNFSGSGVNYTFRLNPTTAGVFSAQVQANRFTDAVGNNNTASNILSRTRS